MWDFLKYLIFLIITSHCSTTVPDGFHRIEDIYTDFGLQFALKATKLQMFDRLVASQPEIADLITSKSSSLSLYDLAEASELTAGDHEITLAYYVEYLVSGFRCGGLIEHTPYSTYASLEDYELKEFHCALV